MNTLMIMMLLTSPATPEPVSATYCTPYTNPLICKPVPVRVIVGKEDEAGGDDNSGWNPVG